MVVHVSLDDVKQAHYEILEQYGGLDGVRDDTVFWSIHYHNCRNNN